MTIKRKRDARDKYERAADRCDSINTCRDCKDMCAGGDAVKYGVRHYVCVDCAILRGTGFLFKLKTWQLKRLPRGPLIDAKLLAAVKQEVERRELAEALARRTEMGGLPW
jgi:hypothetical protein